MGFLYIYLLWKGGVHMKRLLMALICFVRQTFLTIEPRNGGVCVGSRILQSIEERQGANQVYLEEGIRILELSRKAYALLDKQQPRGKRRLLNLLLSNCSWKNGELTATFRQPLNMIAEMKSAHQKKKATSLAKSSLSENWLPE
jgi:hypothetical protein